MNRFITSMIELKLDADTMFEWQRHSQGSTEVPHFSILLEFLNLQEQASESSVHEFNKKRDHTGGSKNFLFHASFSTVVEEQCNCESLGNTSSSRFLMKR